MFEITLVVLMMFGVAAVIYLVDRFGSEQDYSG
jgi:hypothetical protein